MKVTTILRMLYERRIYILSIVPGTISCQNYLCFIKSCMILHYKHTIRPFRYIYALKSDEYSNQNILWLLLEIAFSFHHFLASYSFSLLPFFIISPAFLVTYSNMTRLCIILYIFFAYLTIYHFLASEKKENALRINETYVIKKKTENTKNEKYFFT